MAPLSALFVSLLLLVVAAKNAFGIGSTSSGHITKLEQCRFSLDIYAFLWNNAKKIKLLIAFIASQDQS